MTYNDGIKRDQGKERGMYKVLTVAGVALFAAANAWVTSQRGYWAVGGEALFLALPAYVWMARIVIETEREEA